VVTRPKQRQRFVDCTHPLFDFGCQIYYPTNQVFPPLRLTVVYSAHTSLILITYLTTSTWAELVRVSINCLHISDSPSTSIYLHPDIVLLRTENHMNLRRQAGCFCLQSSWLRACCSAWFSSSVPFPICCEDGTSLIALIFWR
jgi:hypothetical protein